jgi:hypothetical protein
MSAADCTLGPLARAEVDDGGYIKVWWRKGQYIAETEEYAGYGKTAQEACDNLERTLDSQESAEFDMIAKTVYPEG